MPDPLSLAARDGGCSRCDACGSVVPDETARAASAHTLLTLTDVQLADLARKLVLELVQTGATNHVAAMQLVLAEAVARRIARARVAGELP